MHGASHVTRGVRNIVDLFWHQNVSGSYQEQRSRKKSYKPRPTMKAESRKGRNKQWILKGNIRKRKAAHDT